MAMFRHEESGSGWKDRLHEVIFEADTPMGKTFDVILLWCILLSVTAVVLESVKGIEAVYGSRLRFAEWGFTILFTIEYVLRLMCVRRPAAYARSFFGVVDLLAILPTYVSLFIPGMQPLLLLRALRLIRVFRVLKLARYVGESQVLMNALRASRVKITVFLVTVLMLVLVIGTLMYLIEGEENGFTSIPKGVYWAVVTMTTVGYGDIAPHTVLGQTLAAGVMILGYGIIAVPTGIVTAEIAYASRAGLVSTQSCRSCSAEGHDPDAKFCKFCGEEL